jgi:hypothetical protein
LLPYGGGGYPYFGQFYENYRSCQKFYPHFSSGKKVNYALILTENILGATFWAFFSQTLLRIAARVEDVGQ